MHWNKFPILKSKQSTIVEREGKLRTHRMLGKRTSRRQSLSGGRHPRLPYLEFQLTDCPRKLVLLVLTPVLFFSTCFRYSMAIMTCTFFFINAPFSHFLSMLLCCSFSRPKGHPHKIFALLFYFSSNNQPSGLWFIPQNNFASSCEIADIFVISFHRWHRWVQPSGVIVTAESFSANSKQYICENTFDNKWGVQVGLFEKNDVWKNLTRISLLIYFIIIV